MSQVDEGLIHAWLDGQLSAEDASRVERLVASDAEWGTAAAEARGLVAGASRILGALDNVPTAYGSEQQQRNARPRPKVSRISWSAPWVRAAAVVVLVVGVSSVVWLRTPQDEMIAVNPEPPATMREQTPRPTVPTAAGVGSGQGTAAAGARIETERTAPPARPVETAADRAFAARAAQPEARRDSVNPRVSPRADDLARARAVNEVLVGRATAPVPVPLVEQGVVGGLRSVATDSAAKALGDGMFDARLVGCWMQNDSIQSLADVAARQMVGQVAGRAAAAAAGGGGRGGRGAAADSRVAQERDEAARRNVAVFRFIAPVATDILTALSPPPAPAAPPLPLARAESSMAPLPVLTNAQTRLLPDSSYVAEFIDARGRTELTFRVVGDTIRGRSRLTVNTVALPERAFVAVKTACPR